MVRQFLCDFPSEGANSIVRRENGDRRAEAVARGQAQAARCLLKLRRGASALGARMSVFLTAGAQEVSDAPAFKCSECASITLCVHCFCAGVEIDGHLRTHGYSVSASLQFEPFHVRGAGL